jgi:hypothetical protein
VSFFFMRCLEHVMKKIESTISTVDSTTWVSIIL